MPGAVEGRAYGRDVRHRAGRGLVVDDADGLDLVPGVGLQALAYRFGIGAVAPVSRDELRVQAEPLCHVLP